MTSSCRASDAEAVGFVLAGGQSSRMGMDKARLNFRGQPLIARAVNILAGAGLSVVIAGAPPDARAPLAMLAPVLPDSVTGLGPLGGICTALKFMAASYAVFLPVDIPFLPASLIRYLLRHAQLTESVVTLASVNGFVQTFPAVLSHAAYPALQEELRCGRLGCLAAFRAAAAQAGQDVLSLPAEVLVQSGQVSHPNALPVLRWFLNLNAEQDLRRASSISPVRVI